VSHEHDTPITSAVHAADPTYYEIARPWTDLGLVVLPGRAARTKLPAVGLWGQSPHEHDGISIPGHEWSEVHGGNRDPEALHNMYEAWCERRVCGLLLPASGPVPLVVIDVDDPRWTGWVEANFGASSGRCETGRDGGGVQLYYRMPSESWASGGIRNLHGVLGPNEAWIRDVSDDGHVRWHTKIDVKGAGGYVVAPGSIHKTGRRYRFSIPVDEAMIAQLPVLDLRIFRELEEQGRAHGVRLRAAETRVTVQVASSAEPEDGPATPSTLGAELPHDVVVRDAVGRSFVPTAVMRAGEKVEIYSPWRSEQTPSAFVRCMNWGANEGRCFVHDSANSETRWIQGWSDVYLQTTSIFHEDEDLKEEDGPVVPPRREDEGSDTPAWCGHADVRVIELPPGRYWSDVLGDIRELLPDGGLIVAAGPLGSGKTVWTARQAATMKSVCVITDGIALAEATARQYRCVPYTDPSALGDDRIVTTTHSAYKFPSTPKIAIDLLDDNVVSLDFGRDAFRRDMSVVEECNRVRAAWHSAILRGMGVEAKEATLAHLASGQWAVASSADMMPEEADWWIRAFRARRPDAPVLIVWQRPTPGTRTIQLLRPSVLREQLDADLRDHRPGAAPLILLTTSEAAPEELAERMKVDLPELRVWWCSSRNSQEPTVRAALRDPDQILRQYDVIAVSPVIVTGLSWTVPVRRVYLEANAPDIVASALCQMLMRARVPEDPVLRASLVSRRGEWDLDGGYLRRVALRLEAATRGTIDRTMVQFRLDWRTGQRAPTDDEVMSSWVLVEQERRRTANGTIRELVRTCRRHGWGVDDRRSVTVTDEERARERRGGERAAKASVDCHHAEGLLRADGVSRQRVEELKKKHELTSEERAEVERHRMEEFYGRELTEDLIDYDSRGKARPRLRDLVAVRLWQAGVRNFAALRDHWSSNGTDGKKHRHATEHHHHVLRIRLLSEILHVVTGGARVDDVDGLRFSKEQLVSRIGPWLARADFRRRARELLGSSCSSASAGKPVQWVMGVLRRLGIRHTATRPGGCERERVYNLQAREALALAQAELRRSVRALIEARGGKAPPLGMYQPDWGPSVVGSISSIATEEALRREVEEILATLREA
jgi:hypothetical protein